jgi:uncharacterized 2Fe-2S/4Fe-4S cluster protein (DUF4445 family)
VADPRLVLACQHLVTRDLIVEVGRTFLGAGVIARADTVGSTGEAIEVDPALRKAFFAPDLMNEADPKGLRSAVASSLGESGGRVPSLAALRGLGSVYAQGRTRGFTAVLAVGPAAGESTILGVEPGDTTGTLLGAAVDIGTTTVVLYLYDLTDGRRLAVTSCLNRQAEYGGDVISRIAAVMRERDPGRLQEAVLVTVAGLLNEACDLAGVTPRDVYELVAVGNSTMHHLFFGIDPTCLGRYPFWLVERAMLSMQADDLPTLGLSPLGRVVFLPLIGGHLGADTTAVVLATAVHHAAGYRLIIDIGTNGEIVLGGRDGLWACSAAAGPALEGSGISCGMRAQPGAIDDVRIQDGRVHLTVIGGGRPEGICGSGVVATVAEMLRTGIIRASGKMAAGGLDHLVLATAEESATGRPIVFTQADVRAVQLAKGAIAAGIRTLFDEAGIEPGSLSEILLAGAFGNYIDIEDAKAIGLLPDIPGAPVRPVGNAAGAGAQMALLSQRHRAEAESLLSRIVPVHLSLRPEFQKLFTGCLSFPPPTPPSAGPDGFHNQ